MSTAIYGSLKTKRITISDDFLPTPGNFINSFGVLGTRPSYSSNSFLLVARIFFDLALYNPAGLIACMICSCVSFIISCGVLANANN